MRIAFVKTGEPHNRIYVTRDDGAELGWRWPASPVLPHDLAHFAVESWLRLGDGFWGRVAAGVDFGAVNAAGHSPGGPRPGDGDVTGLITAEALVVAAMPDPPGLHRTVADRRAELAAACARRDIPVPALDDDATAALVAVVADYDSRWRALGTRAALLVEWVN